MTVLGASIEIALLITLLTVIVLYVWVVDMRRSARTGRLLKWVRTHHPIVWNAQPWGNRHINRWGGLVKIHREQLIDDPYFDAEMRAVRPNGRLIGFMLAAAALILLTIWLGVRYWGWQW